MVQPPMDDLAFIRTRTVVCDREKLCALMHEKKLTAKQLAANAGLYVETVENMILGKGIYKSTVRAVAQALDVEPITLVANPDEYLAVVNPAPVSNPKICTLVFEIDRSILDKAETIVFKIRRDSHGQGFFDVSDDKQGNRSITVEMDAEDAIRVTTAFITGKLDAHGVKSVTLLNTQLSQVFENPFLSRPSQVVGGSKSSDQEISWEQIRPMLTVLASRMLSTIPELRIRVDEEDLVQEALLKAHQAWNDMRSRDPNATKAWLRAILRSVFKDAVAFAMRDIRSLDTEESIHEALDNSSHRLEQFLESKATPDFDRLLDLTAALEKLVSEEREIVIAHDIEGKSLEQIAKDVGLDKNIVARKLHQAHSSLHRLLQNS
jgi:RNA polymerase sigma factor (sigma-70 family)